MPSTITHSSVHMAVDQCYIFVEFGDRKAARRARKAIAGRSFDGKIVIVDYYPLESFKAGDYTAAIIEPGEEDNPKEENEDPPATNGEGMVDGEEEQGGHVDTTNTGDNDEDDDDFAVTEEPQKPGPVTDVDLD